MPIAERLKEDLGEPVYYFKNWDDDLNDDYAHRFLVLHFCCVLCPESRYVRYLTEISGATDVHELKAALLNPASYTAPYQMKPVMDSYEPLRCVFDYSKNTGKHRATFVTYSETAADTLRLCVAQAINQTVTIVHRESVSPIDILGTSGQHCSRIQTLSIPDKQSMLPESLITNTDELVLVGDDITSSAAPDEILTLARLAYHRGITVRRYQDEGFLLWEKPKTFP